MMFLLQFCLVHFFFSLYSIPPTYRFVFIRFGSQNSVALLCHRRKIAGHRRKLPRFAYLARIRLCVGRAFASTCTFWWSPSRGRTDCTHHHIVVRARRHTRGPRAQSTLLRLRELGRNSRQSNATLAALENSFGS